MNAGRMGKGDPRQIFGLDRRAVAQAFDRASGSYDAAAALQERVRNELLERLDELQLTPCSILDLGEHRIEVVAPLQHQAAEHQIEGTVGERQ